MELLTYYQGDDIPFQIELFEDDEQKVPVNIDNLTDLIVYVYTDGTHVIKLAKVAKTGYTTLSRNTAYIYTCLIDSEQTKLMSPGPLKIEINNVNTASGVLNNRLNKIGAGHIGYLNKSLIKIES